MKINVIVFSTLVMLICITSVDAFNWNGTVGYWNFNNASNFGFSSTGIRNWTQSGSLSAGTNCLISSCAKESGNATANYLSQFEFINSTLARAVSIWFKFDQLTGSTTIIARGQVGLHTDLQMDVNSTGAFLASVADTSSTNSTPVISANTWNNAIFSWNTTGTNVYVNGVLFDIFATKVPVVNNETDFLFRSPSLTTQNKNLTLDEMSVFNRTLNASEVNELWNGGFGLSYLFSGGVTLLSPADNTTMIDGRFSAIHVTLASTNSSNATIGIFYQNGTLFTQQTLTNGTSPNAVYNWTVSNLTAGNYLWNVTACSVSNICTSSNTQNFQFGIVENSQTFNPTVTSGSLQTFSINLTLASGFHATLPTLVYNNTSYLPDLVLIDGNNYIYSRNITLPTVTSSTVKNFYWSLTLTNGVTSHFNSSTQSQTISPFQGDNCTLYNSNIFNFSLFDEDSLQNINGTIELDLDFYSTGTNVLVGSLNRSYTYVAGTPSRVCINQTNSSLTVNYHARYYSNVSLYVVEHKFGQNIPTANLSQSINLYDLLDARSTTCSITLQSASLDSISGAVIDISREYVNLNQFISVESPLTDVYGTTLGHFVADEVYYTFIVTQNGNLLGTFERQLVKPQNLVTGECTIQLNLIETTADPPDFQTYGNISANYLWSSSTRLLTLTWISSDAASHTITQNVTIFDNWGNNTVCTTTNTGVSGSYVCTVPVTYGNSSIISYLYSDGIFLGFSTFDLGDTSDDIYSGTKVVFGILMYCTLTLLMISNPITLIIGSILGIAFMMVFHIADGGSFIGNSSIFLWWVIAGGVIIYHISKRT